MAITVKHLKVSTVPDAGDDTLVEPSDWNADHTIAGTIPVENGGTGADTLTGYVKGNGTANMTASATIPSTDVTGLGTMAAQNANNVAITGGTMSGVAITGYIPTTEKAQPLGVATLDAGGKVPTSQIPMQGDLNYQGTWNATTNTPTLVSSTGTKGYYYVVDVAGTTNLDGITDWQIGDWAIYNGTVWQKVDNTDAVTSVNGQVGTVVLTASSVGAVPTTRLINTGTGLTGGGDLSADRTIAIDSTVATLTGTQTLTNKTLTSPKVNEILDANGNEVLGLLSTASATDYVGIKNGIGVGVPLHISAEGSSTNVGLHIQPKGTGLVTISDGTDFNKGIRFRSSGSAASAVTLLDAVATAGRVVTLPDATTTLVGRDTTDTLTNKSISGSTNTLTNIANASLTNSAITINGVSTPLGGSASVGTVTSVSATAGTGIAITGSPITGSGTLNITNTAPDQTVAITAGTGISVTGTYPNFSVTNTAPSSGGTVTSVTGTAPVVSSGGNTPAISLAASYGDTQNPYASKTANFVLAAPNGSAGVPTFRAIVAADIPTLNQNTTGTASNVTGTVAIANGGTGATTAPNALTALGAYPASNPNGYTSNVGTVTSIVTGTGLTGGPITGSGTVALANTAVTAGSYTNSNITVDAQGRITSASNGSSAAGVLTFSAGTTGFTPVLATSGAVVLGGTLGIANGGTGETTRQNAMDALAGSVTSGQYLRGNGTDVVMSAIQAADVPTLNQSTTGNAATATTATNQSGGTVNATSILTSAGIGAYNGVASDPYGFVSVTEVANANNFSYYGLTRSGSMGAGFGLTGTTGALGLGSNSYWFGTATAGASGTMSAAWISFNGTNFATAGTVASNAGTVSLPAYSTTGDTNTGMFFPAADTLAFAEGGLEVMRISSASNVGIGTSNPLNKLHVSASDTGNVVGASVASINLSNSNAGAFGRTMDYQFSVGAGASTEKIGAISGIYTNFGTSVGGAIAFCTNNGSSSFAERMRITSAGQLRTTVTGSTLMDEYGCRAWVNFNGGGTVAIRASGNVSSITDNGTGDYTVNFTTAMPDANYAVSGILSNAQPVGNSIKILATNNTTAPTLMTASACRLAFVTNSTAEDYQTITATFVR